MKELLLLEHHLDCKFFSKRCGGTAQSSPGSGSVKNEVGNGAMAKVRE